VCGLNPTGGRGFVARGNGAEREGRRKGKEIKEGKGGERTLPK